METKRVELIHFIQIQNKKKNWICLNSVMLEKWNETQEIQKQGGILELQVWEQRVRSLIWLSFTFSNSIYSLFFSTPIFPLQQECFDEHTPIYLLG